MTGPGIKKNANQISPAVTTIDLAPTILDASGLDPTSYGMDGLSLIPKMTQNVLDEDPNRQFLIEYHGESSDTWRDPRCPKLEGLGECSFDWGCKCQDARNNTYNCLRSLTSREDIIFCQFKDDIQSQEFYDLKADPFQLHNQHVPDNYEYFELLEKLSNCKGADECNPKQEDQEIVIEII